MRLPQAAGACRFRSVTSSWIRSASSSFGAVEPVPLEPKAFELLDLLLDRRPRVLTKAQIRDVLWPGLVVGETSLPRLVADLRQALGDDVQRPRFIRTVHGYGYAFCGEAREDGQPEAASPPGQGASLGEGRPYPGLSAFTEADAGQFFGREAEVAALWETVAATEAPRSDRPVGGGKDVVPESGCDSGAASRMEHAAA